MAARFHIVGSVLKVDAFSLMPHHARHIFIFTTSKCHVGVYILNVLVMINSFIVPAPTVPQLFVR